MIRLTPRLAAIAEQIPPGSRVADIGTDHAYLPIWLMQSGRAERVIACDIGEGPLAVARENIYKEKAEGIELRLCGGLSGLSPGEADVVVIAGMGGELIARIIAETGWLRDSGKLLILQPMSSAENLREFLCLHGFDIVKEQAVFDNRRVYAVMQVRYSGIKRTPDLLYCFIGRMAETGGAGELAYIRRQHARLVRRAEGIRNVVHKRPEFSQLKELISRMDAVLSRLNGRTGPDDDGIN